MTKAESDWINLVNRFNKEQHISKLSDRFKMRLTPEEHLQIEKLCRKMSSRDIANAIGRSRFAVEHYMRKHKLFAPKWMRNKWKRKKMSSRSSATADEDLFLQMWYLTLPSKQVAYFIGRSDTFVSTRMRQLGLVKPKWLIYEHKSCFQKGHVPKNKGKKQTEYMSREAIKRSEATRFQKGHMPANHFEERSGVITIRQDHIDRASGRYRLWIKLDHAKWQELTRYVWEKTHGLKIPPGHIIWQRDQDWMNVDPSNLECITRGQEARRNHNPGKMAITLKNKWKDLQGITDKHIVSFMTRDNELRKLLLQTPDLIQVKRLQLQLRQKIKTKFNEQSSPAIVREGQKNGRPALPLQRKQNQHQVRHAV